MPDDERLFAVQALDGRGLGCVAVADIARGTRLLAEPPLTLEGPALPSVEEQLAVLDAAERARFFSLAQEERLYGHTTTVDGIVGTNGIPFLNGDDDYGGVFPVASRFNHSCAASAIYQWNGFLGRLTVHAARDVARGEELTFNYDGFGSVFARREIRQAHLRTTFGFGCACAKCGLSGRALDASEQRTVRMGEDGAYAAELAAWDVRARGGAAALVERLESRHALVQAEVT
jgi:hypothetical protein